MQLNGNAMVRNLGPDTPVLGDLTFDLIAPSDCVVTPALSVVVQNLNMIINTSVFTSRIWNATCSLTGAHDFTLQASVVPDGAGGAVDPDTTNNSGQSLTGTVQLN